MAIPKMTFSDAWSDDGGTEWISLVTGENEEDHLFSVYGATKDDAETRANEIIMAINFQAVAMEVRANMMSYLPDEEESLDNPTE
jgi:hypothetical protein